MMCSKLRQADIHFLDIDEPSAITFISAEAGFLVFADESSTIWQVRKPEANQKCLTGQPLRLDGDAIPDIEGATYDPETGLLRVLSEQSRYVYEFGVTIGSRGHVALDTPRRHRRRLKRVQRKSNHGYEGITTLPADLSPDGWKWNVAVNELKPRRVCFFDPSTLRYSGHAKLPKAAKALFPDLSSVVVADDGALFLLSDKGNCFGEFSLSRSTESSKDSWKIHLVEHTPIALNCLQLGSKKRLQPEGMTFDDRGDLWVVAEGNGLLVHFRRFGKNA